MKILILRSIDTQLSGDLYSIRMDTNSVNKFISHFTDKPGFCKPCGKECINCRNSYNLDFSENISKNITNVNHIISITKKISTEYQIVFDDVNSDNLQSTSGNETLIYGIEPESKMEIEGGGIGNLIRGKELKNYDIDDNVVVIGQEIAQKYSVNLTDIITINKIDLEIIGIFNSSFSS